MKTNTPRCDKDAKDCPLCPHRLMECEEMISADLGRQMERDLYEAAKIIRRLLTYADRTAEKHPQAVTSAGQNARVRADICLARFVRDNADNPNVKAPNT